MSRSGRHEVLDQGRATPALTEPRRPRPRLGHVLVTPHMATADRAAVVETSRAVGAKVQPMPRGEPPNRHG